MVNGVEGGCRKRDAGKDAGVPGGACLGGRHVGVPELVGDAGGVELERGEVGDGGEHAAVAVGLLLIGEIFFKAGEDVVEGHFAIQLAGERSEVLLDAGFEGSVVEDGAAGGIRGGGSEGGFAG